MVCKALGAVVIIYPATGAETLFLPSGIQLNLEHLLCHTLATMT